MLFMASHAHSTRTHLLPLSRSVPPLLGQGLGRQSGPVTQAIGAMRAAEPLPSADAAIEAIREGPIRYFVDDDGADRQRVRELRRRIAGRIEADLALLDALDGDPDIEPGLGAPEPVLGGGLVYARDGRGCRFEEQERWADGVADDREQDAGDEGEGENEHGGDVQDEPHDGQPDREPDADDANWQSTRMAGGGYGGGSFGGHA